MTAPETIHFPDVEQVGEDLANLHGYGCKYLPAEFDQLLESGQAVILVARVGGTDDGVTDRALVQFAVYGIDRPTAWNTSQALQTSVRSLQWGGQVGAVYVDSTATAAGRVQVPDVDPDDRRVITVYQIDTRRQ